MRSWAHGPDSWAPPLCLAHAGLGPGLGVGPKPCAYYVNKANWSDQGSFLAQVNLFLYLYASILFDSNLGCGGAKVVASIMQFCLLLYNIKNKITALLTTAKQ